MESIEEPEAKQASSQNQKSWDTDSEMEEE